jgi:hypothetical protein
MGSAFRLPIRASRESRNGFESKVMIAYLDTNVFDHLYKKIGCSSADIANLRKAVYAASRCRSASMSSKSFC